MAAEKCMARLTPTAAGENDKNANAFCSCPELRRDRVHRSSPIAQFCTTNGFSFAEVVLEIFFEILKERIAVPPNSYTIPPRTPPISVVQGVEWMLFLHAGAL